MQYKKINLKTFEIKNSKDSLAPKYRIINITIVPFSLLMSLYKVAAPSSVHLNINRLIIAFLHHSTIIANKNQFHCSHLHLTSQLINSLNISNNFPPSNTPTMPPLRPSPLTSLLPRQQFTSSIRRVSSTSSTWTGRKPEGHVTNQDHDHNIQSSASNSGQRTRAEEYGKEDSTSGATSEKDASGTKGGRNAEGKGAKANAGIGLQDERGGVSGCWLMMHGGRC